MYDNKIRLSPDVMQKAEAIASEWGLKNVRAAVEAVFRRYADEYLSGSTRFVPSGSMPPFPQSTPQPSNRCEALNELDDLLNM